MPESGTAKGSSTTKKSKLGGSKKTSHPTQSKVVEKLNAAQSSSRAGSKSPVPPIGKPIANAAISKSKSPQPPNVPAIAPATANPTAEPAKVVAPEPAAAVPDPVVAPVPADTTAPAKVTGVAEQVAVTESSKPLPVSPISTGPTPHKVTTADEIFPDMVWEDEITDLLASAASPPAVPVILAPEKPLTHVPDFDSAVITARSKKDKSPRRQKAKSKSPAPKSIAAAAAADAVPVPPTDSQNNLLSPQSPVHGSAPNPATDAAPEIESQPLTCAGKPVSGPVDPPQPSPPQQAATADERSAKVSANGSQKSERKKNKSRSDDEPAIEAVFPPATVAPASTIDSVKNIPDEATKQIPEPISPTQGVTNVAGDVSKVEALEKENKALKKTVEELITRVAKLETRVSALGKPSGATCAPAPNHKTAPMSGPVAKSSVILDVKPWDDETDMKALEQAVRSIRMDGLLWGASKLVPVAFNIQKLSIVSVVEDEKVSIDELQEKIEKFEDYVQSVDIAGFNKI